MRACADRAGGACARRVRARRTPGSSTTTRRASASRATSARLDGCSGPRSAAGRARAADRRTRASTSCATSRASSPTSRKIRGQIEVLTYELTEAQKRQRDLYVDLDSRMRKLEAAPAPPRAAAARRGAAAPPPPTVANAPATCSPPAPAAPPAVPLVPVSAQEQKRVRRRARPVQARRLQRRDCVGFQAFVKTYPRSLLASSAQYWVGNAQFARKDYRAAIASQRQLIQLWPDSAKVPDALLNIASAQSELGDNARRGARSRN